MNVSWPSGFQNELIIWLFVQHGLYQVYVDEDLCGTIKVTPGVLVYPISCQKKGDSVKIRTSKQYLTLCEVEVIGKQWSVLSYFYSSSFDYGSFVCVTSTFACIIFTLEETVLILSNSKVMRKWE